MERTPTYGFALLELIVSITIFVVLITSATTVYIRFLEQNRRTQELRQITDQARVLAERIRNDLNTARKDTNGTTLCIDGPFPRVYSQTSSDQIRFIDADGKCAGYLLYDAGRGTKTIFRGDDLLFNPSFAAMTTPTVNVTELRFTVYDDQFIDQYPLVDIFFELEKNNSELPPISVAVSSALLVE